ncbi:cobalamin biosynthesis protein CobD [Rhodobacteraceae bacterium 2CG4]|uniref:Cobalamin biosynthesis protein CobD n=1 Tax=Halovulum marinum TaxID=2662447 RepID=A0A6L5Z3A3_9RHOB|nr:adenosylcobinamide-phosphate synthase CbiB [Halovulum marinum]MSU90464.1 cobalamin biosynthesis protein CobD [Halovulum marinum]
MLLALGLDAIFGWPAALYRRIGHPVTWIGALIARLDRAWNDDAAPARARVLRGAAAVAVVLAAAVLPAALVTAALPGGWAGVALTGVLAAPLLAGRSLHDHVARVARPLARGDLPGARLAVSMIVGRDPASLDAPGIARAALESLGENASDGVIAPLFWGVLLGLPGIAGYKAVNTLDSMIGYRTARHDAFGRVAARLDDAANWVPARLTALCFALASGRPAAVLRGARPDAPLHRSPNAGWPEAALAHALGVRLSGPRVYATGAEAQPWVNAGAPDPDAGAIGAGLRLYLRMVAVAAVATGLVAVI